MHLDGAGVSDCDHWHDDADAQGLTDYGESQIFAADWFGDASPDNSLHTVDNGRTRGTTCTTHTAFCVPPGTPTRRRTSPATT
ncbi:unnamed protein product [Ectocarpus fasciculatus]